MRKVNFSRYIKPEMVDSGKGYTTRKEGTGCYEEGFPNEGVFHQWGSTYEEFDNGPANQTVAIVELANGLIEEVIPSRLKFLEPKQ
jgi:hypothetical protein